MKRPASLRSFANKGFSLVELLIVISVISIITTVAVQAIVFTRGTALESAISAQEHSINTSYRALKAVAANPLPTTREEIIEVIESDPNVGFPVPRTMEGPDGICTLHFDAASERFSYIRLPDDPAPLVTVN
jgi:prepilin-type N-terminal cleavage/methylation domain-containing protein